MILKTCCSEWVRRFFLFLVLSCGLLNFSSLRAADYRHLLPVGVSLFLQQENSENHAEAEPRRTIIRYQQERGQALLIETIRSFAGEQRLSTTVLHFSSASGEIINSRIQNHLRGIEVFSQFQPGEIVTRISKDDKEETYTSPETLGTVPYTLLMLYLRDNMEHLKQRKKLEFKLYLPFIIPKLKRLGMPTSFATIEVAARWRKQVTVQIKNKEVQGARVNVRPVSSLIAGLLPGKYRELSFVFAVQSPHYLLASRTGDVRLQLVEMRLPDAIVQNDGDDSSPARQGLTDSVQ